MLYIVTEDKNSARDFWEIVAKTFRQPGTYTLVQLPINTNNNTVNGGNTTLVAQVNALLPKLQQDDTLFVAFDNVGNTSSFNPKNFLKKTDIWCSNHGVKFMYTTYYCFEEIYLSYDELLLLFPQQIAKYQYIFDTLKYVNNCINNQMNYYTNNTIVHNFINNHPDAGRNREHFDNQLLEAVTKLMKLGHFSITKRAGTLSSAGACWVISCSEIQKKKNPEEVKNLCNAKCNFSCKHKNARDKLLDLNNRSLFRKSKIQLYEIARC